MNLHRRLEPEVMDSPQDAEDYDAMDHADVNQRFVDDLLAAGHPVADVLDLGTGTAQIPILLCQRLEDCRVMAVDLAISMLELARTNIEVASCADRIFLRQVDAKALPFEDGLFQVAVSNSIIHHIPDPCPVLDEAVRVTAEEGWFFFRDLLRPDNLETLNTLVETYAGQANAHQRKLFEDSLHAALSLQEIRELIVSLGFPADSVQATSDRHWTWRASKSARREKVDAPVS